MAQGLRLVLFGPPGAGKGTQAQLLAGQLEVSHISSGDLFRHHLQAGTPLGLRAAGFMDRGVLVPDEVTIDIVLERVLGLASERGFILDGFPRNRNQAQVLEEALSRRSRGLDKVVYIMVAEGELVRRLAGRFSCRRCQAPHNISFVSRGDGARVPDRTGGQGEAATAAGEALRCERCGGELYQRPDDRPEAVSKRIEVYLTETLPVLEFYRGRGLLAEISGVGSIEAVNRRVLAAVVPYHQPAGSQDI